MIIDATIISRPYSGEFDETIYDVENPWNSQNWTYVKFTDENYYEWCGVFRGFPEEVKISNSLKAIIVLTSNYLYQIEIENGSLIERVENKGFNIMTVSPTGIIILGYYYYLAKVESTIKEIINIDSPIQMDLIKFKHWEENKLKFTCDEFLNWDRHLELELDCDTWKIKIVNGG